MCIVLNTFYLVDFNLNKTADEKKLKFYKQFN